MRHDIDETDVIILNLLIENARMTYADIAKKVGMKSPSVIDRIKRLESEGIIKNYSVEISYEKLGYDIMAFIGVSVDNAQHIVDFEDNMQNLHNDIIECHHVTGDFTMLLKVITKNTSTLSELIKEIRNLPGVQKTNTLLVFSSLLDKRRSV